VGERESEVGAQAERVSGSEQGGRKGAAAEAGLTFFSFFSFFSLFSFFSFFSLFSFFSCTRGWDREREREREGERG
jgi:hypothetical protein